MLKIAIAFLAVLAFVMPVAAQPVTITIDVADKADNEAGFDLERAPGDCTGTPAFVKVGSLAPAAGVGAVTATTDSVAAGATYCWRVRAFNALGSNYSNTIKLGPPLAPSISAR